MDEFQEPHQTKEEILSQFEERDGKYIHKLKEKIQFGTELIEEFELQKPKAKHIRNMPQKPGMDAVLKIVGKLAGQPDKVIDELSMEDVNVLAEYFGAFS